MSQTIKVASLLRSKELEEKKLDKLIGNLSVYEALRPSEKSSTNHANAASTMQAIYDKMKGLLTIYANLRRANVTVNTSMQNYFTGRNLTLIECKDTTRDGEQVGVLLEPYFLTELQRHIASQINTVKESVRVHNQTKRNELQQRLDKKYAQYQKDRKSQEELGGVSDTFDSDYEESVRKMTDAFWEKNLAKEVDTINVFAVVSKLTDWITNFDKKRNLAVNAAIQTEFCLDNVAQLPKAESTMSLEELNLLIREQQVKINTAIQRLCSVSWKVVSDSAPKDSRVESAHKDLETIFGLIRSYGEMIRVQKLATTCVNTNVENPLTGAQMSGIDALDFEDVCINRLRNVLDRIEDSRLEKDDYVKSKASEVRTGIAKLLEGALAASSSRPTPDKLKEYSDKLYESEMPVVRQADGVDTWIKRYTEIIDIYETTIKNGLSSSNATTQVPVTWENVNVDSELPTWDNDFNIQILEQPQQKQGGSRKSAKYPQRVHSVRYSDWN